MAASDSTDNLQISQRVQPRLMSAQTRYFTYDPHSYTFTAIRS